MSTLETVVLLCLVVAVSVTILIIRDAVRNQRTQFDPDAPTIEPATVSKMEAVGAVKESLPTAFTLRPNWDEAPEWAMWAAQDPEGPIFWFELKPTPLPATGVWFTGADNFSLHATGPANPNWKQAIEQRPVEAKPDIFVFADSPDPATWVTTEGVSLPAPERDNCELISRDELERLRKIEDAYVADHIAPEEVERLNVIERAAIKFCVSKHERDYLRLCKVLEVQP